MFESPEDRLLIQRCLERLPGAWEAFLQRYLPLFHHVARKTAHLSGFTPTLEDIEDCLAEILLQILSDQFKVLKNFQGESSLGTYLLVVARRRAARFWINRKKNTSLGGKADSIEAEQAPDLTEEPLVIGDELGKLLSSLPVREREAVRLHHLEGFSYTEVASQLRIPVNSVGPLLSKARKRLHRAAKQVG